MLKRTKGLSRSRNVTDTLSLVVHPYAAWLHILWHWHGRRNRRFRREIRSAFSDRFYLDSYPELRKLKIGPVRHYIVKGWKEGRDPSELFSTTSYLKMYGDVRDAGINPFFHYLHFGRQEGRSASMSLASGASLSKPDSLLTIPEPPTDAEWAALPKLVIDPPTAPGVNVIIPVYKSIRHTAATIQSVLKARNETPVECLVIDDASPEPEVSALLRRLAGTGHIRLIVNEANEGFVRTVNAGMAHNAQRDVILLNADTWVSDGWVDRIVRPFRDDPTIATVTPLSNNATIASYPNTVVDNAYELEAGPGTLDGLAFEANGHKVVDIPTGIGFCMAIRRKALNEVGLFDAETFGIGYGEESDFCTRALKAKWRNVLATGVYVRHYGSTSFGAAQLARSEEAQRLLAIKHPDYAHRVGRHIAADPALPSRILFDAVRLREAVGPVSVLFFSHTRGGGIDTYLRNTRLTLRAAGLREVADRAVLIQHQVDGFVKVKGFGAQNMPYLPNLQGLNLRRHNALLPRFIELLDPGLIHTNTFAGLSLQEISGLMDAIEGSGKPYWHIWHDHQPLCPRLTFLDSEERYCGETDVRRCHACLTSTPSHLEWVKVEEWRERFRRFLAGAEVVSAPSEAAALRARRICDVARVKVHPHPEPQATAVAPLQRTRREDGKRHVLILGAIGPHKGAYLLHGMIRDIEARKLALHIDVVGYTSMTEIKTGDNVTVHGKYAGDADAVRKIEKIAPDLALFSSIWPETYVYTLSLAMALGLPTAAFDLGAQGDRVRAYARGALLAPQLIEDPVAVNDVLLALDLDRLWRALMVQATANECALSARFLAARAGPGEETSPPPEPRRATRPAAESFPHAGG